LVDSVGVASIDASVVDVAVVHVAVERVVSTTAQADLVGDTFVLELEVDDSDETTTSSDPDRIDELDASGTSGTSWMTRGASTTGCNRSQRVNDAARDTSNELACKLK
jgi:hypothetical protein